MLCLYLWKSGIKGSTLENQFPDFNRKLMVYPGNSRIIRNQYGENAK